MIAIISDIHGNYPALRAVLSDIEKKNCDKIICLGDIAGYYCMINQCINELRERKIQCLLGNHDYYLANRLGCPRSNSANACLNFQESIIEEKNMLWLKNLKTSILKLGNMSLVHGGWQDNLDEYLYNISKDYFENLEGDFFFSGHTHVPVVVNYGDKIYCNPGSVGQPRDGNPKASYAIVDNSNVEIKRVSYDIDEIVFAMKNAGFDEYIYKNLYIGSRIGGDLSKTIVKD